MRLGFLLSHHRREEENRCVRVAGVPVCARCLGMYPALVLGLVALFGVGHRPHLVEAWPFESWILVLLVTPALLDWMRGRAWPDSGTNTVRLLTGSLLGLGLARVVHLHARDPFQGPVLDVLLLLVLGVLAGELFARAYGGDETSQHDPISIPSADPDGSSDVRRDESPAAGPDDRCTHG